MKDSREITFGELIGLLTGAAPEGIIAQEKQGQRDLVANDTLPIDSKPAAEYAFGLFGIKILGRADELFYNVILPDGWKKVPTSHDLHSELVDEQGRKRAAIFYKAAFYDRKADMTFLPRYTASYEPKGGWSADTGEYVAYASDGNNRIWGQDGFTTSQLAIEASRAYLDGKYPQWRDIAAYWNEPQS